MAFVCVPIATKDKNRITWPAWARARGGKSDYNATPGDPLAPKERGCIARYALSKWEHFDQRENSDAVLQPPSGPIEISDPKNVPELFINGPFNIMNVGAMVQITLTAARQNVGELLGGNTAPKFQAVVPVVGHAEGNGSAIRPNSCKQSYLHSRDRDGRSRLKCGPWGLLECRAKGLACLEAKRLSDAENPEPIRPGAPELRELNIRQANRAGVVGGRGDHKR